MTQGGGRHELRAELGGKSIQSCQVAGEDARNQCFCIGQIVLRIEPDGSQIIGAGGLGGGCGWRWPEMLGRHCRLCSRCPAQALAALDGLVDVQGNQQGLAGAQAVPWGEFGESSEKR